MYHVDLIIFYYAKQIKLKLRKVYLDLLVFISFPCICMGISICKRWG